VDEDPLTLPQGRPPEAAERIQPSVAHRRRLLEGDADRLVGDQAALRDADELRVCAERPRVEAEDLVSDREPGDRCAGCFDRARQFAAEDPPLGPPHSREEPPQERVGRTAVAICPVDRRGVDPDQDLIVLGYGPLYILESQDIGRPVPVVNGGLHSFFPPILWRATPSTTSRRDSRLQREVPMHRTRRSVPPLGDARSG
jgi:hypothetical protein